MFYVGIDIGKINHKISIVDDAGILLNKSFSFKNSTDGFRQMLDYISVNNVAIDT